MDVGTFDIKVGPSLHTYCNIHILGPYLYTYRTLSYSWYRIVLGTTVITLSSYPPVFLPKHPASPHPSPFLVQVEARAEVIAGAGAGAIAEYRAGALARPSQGKLRLR